MAALHFRVDKARPPPGIGPPEGQWDEFNINQGEANDTDK